MQLVMPHSAISGAPLGREMEADFCAQCNALFYTTDPTATIVRSAIRRRSHLAPSMSNTPDIIHTKIYNAIVEQRLPPGTKLREKSLWKIFGVSRMLIRRVLRASPMTTW
jgi:hypothetical protein